MFLYFSLSSSRESHKLGIRRGSREVIQLKKNISEPILLGTEVLTVKNKENVYQRNDSCVNTIVQIRKKG
jgi:hypothetical protein